MNKFVEKRMRIWNKYKDVDKDRRYGKYLFELMKNKTAEGRELYNDIQREPWLLIELFFRIRDKDRNLVPFFLNDVQRDLQERVKEKYIMQQKGEINQIKFCILKGRQQGLTTYITALQESFALVKNGFRGYTMAHDNNATNMIFEEKAKNVYNELIDEVKQKVKRSNSRELVLEDTDSAWRVATAGSKGAGRGDTITFLHNSEKAFWKDMAENAKAVSQALVKKSIEIDETTANGYNEFKDHWDEAVAGNNNYIAVFYVWWDTKEYREGFNGESYTQDQFEIAIERGDRFKGVDSDFMKKLKALRYTENLDIEQLHFYYKKRVELKSDVSQEYPCTAKEAFLHSGRPYFDIELIDIQITENRYKPIEVLQGGEIEVYNEPILGHRYVIGADVAEGLDCGDDSSFYVMDVKTGEEVANGVYTATPDQHGHILHKWSQKYNNAMISVERNNHGHSTLNTLKNDCNYSQYLYTEEVLDKKNNEKIKKYGWFTGQKSKYIGLDRLDEDHRHNDITIKSIRLLNEMRECQKENGLVNTNGKDITMAAMIANITREQASYISGTGRTVNKSNISRLL